MTHDVTAAPALEFWAAGDGRVTCPAHADAVAWADMLARPDADSITDSRGVVWVRLSLRWLLDVVSAYGEPACDECRRAVRPW